MSIDYLSVEGTKNIVDDISFNLYNGETWGIVGESDQGKQLLV